jgi:hypothetical protein
VILAAHTSCNSLMSDCVYQYEIYQLNTAASLSVDTVSEAGIGVSTVYSYPGYTTTDAMYTTTGAAVETALPTIGPFSMDRFSGGCSLIPEFSFDGQLVPGMNIDCDDSSWDYDVANCLSCYLIDSTDSEGASINQCGATSLEYGVTSSDLVFINLMYYCYFTYVSE